MEKYTLALWDEIIPEGDEVRRNILDKLGLLGVTRRAVSEWALGYLTESNVTPRRDFAASVMLGKAVDPQDWITRSIYEVPDLTPMDVVNGLELCVMAGCLSRTLPTQTVASCEV